MGREDGGWKMAGETAPGANNRLSPTFGQVQTMVEIQQALVHRIELKSRSSYQPGVGKAAICRQQVDVAEHRFGKHRANGKRLTKSEVCFGLHWRPFGLGPGMVGAP